MSVSDPISAIAIYGAPLEIWSAAALLARELPRDIALKLVETPARHTSPGLIFDSGNLYHARAGISELELIAQCSGNLSLGLLYDGWRADGHVYFDAPAGKLPGLNGVALHHLLLRAAQMRGEAEKMPELAASFRFPALAALNGKLTHPSDDPKSPRSMLRTLVSIDTGEYTDLLRRKANDARPVEHIVAGTDSMAVRDDSGRMAAIQTADGHRIDADLFVDMAGTLEGPGKEKMPHPAFDIIAASIAPADKSGGYNIAKASDDGVALHFALRGKTVELGYHNSGERHGDGKAQDATSTGLYRYFEAEPWQSNLVRAGPASGALSSPHEADIDLVQQQLCRLAGLIPVSRDMHVEAAEYNRLHGIIYGQLRDFHDLPYRLNGRTTPHWKAAAEMEISENLHIRLDQFASRGRFVTFDGETHDEQRWIDMMIGFGHIPRRFDPMARSAQMAKVGQSLGGMVEAFKQTVAAMPAHADYMARVAALAEKEAPIDEFAI